MKKPLNPPEIKLQVPADQWIPRLTTLLQTVDAMDQDERAAAFSFLKSKYREQWPSENF